VEHGAQVSGFLLASLSKADREQLEHMLIAKQQERLRARRVLEEQLALVAAADERTLQYMTLIRNSGDGDGDDDAAADAAADADAPAPFTTQHEAAELHVLSDDDDDNSDDEVEAVAAAAPKEALASSGKGSRRSPRPTVAKKSAAVGAKDLTSPRPLTSSKSAGSGIGERTSPRTLTSSTSATLPPTSATLSPRSDSSESETTSKTSENGAKLTDSLSSKHRRRVHRDKGGGESKGGESKGEPEEVITSPRHRSHGSRTGSSAAASAAAAAAAAAASAAATTAAAAAAATVTPAASEPILSPRRHTSGDLVLPAAASPTDTALDAVVAGLPAPPLPPDSELPQAQTKAAQTQASLAAWRANARKDSFVSSTEILSESNLQKRAALKAEAPPVCTECMERKPRAKLTRNESVLWLCASCLAEKQTLYLKHGTLRRQEALAALQGRFVADTALAVARSAGKATLRRVNKVCGSCGKRKAKHKCTMTTGRQVVLCDKCLLTAKQRRAQLDASFGTAATANMAAAAVAGADSDRL
jgi:hypothetical protein